MSKSKWRVERQDKKTGESYIEDCGLNWSGATKLAEILTHRDIEGRYTFTALED